MTKHKNYGYSEQFLQPYYLAGTTLIFLLAPVLGLFWACLVVLVPALVIAKKAMRRYTKTWADIEAETTDYIARVGRILQTPPHMPKHRMTHIKTSRTFAAHIALSHS